MVNPKPLCISILLPVLLVQVSLGQGMQFEDVSATAGLSTAAGAYGVAVADYDGDGWDDLFFAASSGGSALFRNRGDGTFESTTQQAGIDVLGDAVSPLWADVDNDGDPDLFVGVRSYSGQTSRFYRNNGDGTFTDISAETGVDVEAIVGSASFGDYDNDGRVDLFIATRDSHDRLYRNTGDAEISFEDVTTTASVAGLDYSIAMQATWRDFDRDGDPDLFAVHDGNQKSRFYRQGGGYPPFIEVGTAAGIQVARNSMGVAWGDYDNDGWPDVYVTNIDQANLFRNKGDGTFEDVSASSGTQLNGMSWGAAFADFDNDGDEDLFVGNTYGFDGRQSFLYENRGGEFVDVATSAGVALNTDVYGVATGDFNQDGLLDLIVADGSGRLLLNRTTNTGRWVGLRLEGDEVNKMGIGVTVRVAAGDNSFYRTVDGGSSFCSQLSPQLHFGLADAVQIDTLEIDWGGGSSQRFVGLEANRVHQIRQNSSDQTQQMTFRYIPESSASVVRAFLPGEFNNWGPNSNGIIATNAPSLMTFVDTLSQWTKTISLQIGNTYQYKVHLHQNESGTENQWISDPLNPRINPADNNNSVVEITDPMAFQPAHELTEDALIGAVSAGLFSTEPVTSIQFWVNGIERSGLPFYNPVTGLFRYVLESSIKAGSQFKIKLTDQAGRMDSLEIGEILSPVTWDSPGFTTVKEQATIRASLTAQDGTVDPTLTTAMLHRDDGTSSEVEVVDGAMNETIELRFYDNIFWVEADIENSTFTSDSLTIRRERHPLDDFLYDAAVSGSGNAFTIALDLSRGDAMTGDLTFDWEFDSENSTVDAEELSGNDLTLSGTAAGSGELYFDVVASDLEGEEVYRERIGVIVTDEGEVREMAYDETPAWVNQAVVYEIFPLSFGPQATGTEGNPGMRLRQISDELDYIADMGFNVIWFMPIMRNQFMDPISGGYNVVDFYNVDPKLGTNDDFKALVERAHELGIKVVMDITPNHASPIHPWVESLKMYGSEVPPGSFIQVEPSGHDRGLDNRGPNLSEIWQVGEGGNLYRKYDGFGDLANLNWDEEDLQVEFLRIIEHWIREFNIDGWRFDVYWGPWRRYGPEAFGRPIRELMKRIKPDSWILGEIAGTGFTTEVYYADDDNGTSVVGGIDAGYDWNFFFDGIRGTYGDIGNYDSKIHNGDFWPGPHARYFRFLENHDEERIAKRLAETPERILPLTGMLMTSTGIPMIYQGQEVNFGDVAGDERRVSVNWQTIRNGEFARYHQQLAQARSQFEAFGTQDLITLSTANDVYGFVRPYLNENAVVLINFSSDQRLVSIDPTSAVDLATDGPITYTHLFADSSFVDQELDGFSTSLAPYETAVFIAHGDMDIEFFLPELPELPFGAIYTGAGEIMGEPAGSLELHQNFPNPFSSSTTIRYALPKEGVVRLRVFDMLGRQVAVLIDENKSAGIYQSVFYGKGLPSGIYLLRLEAEGQVKTKHVIIVR